KDIENYGEIKLSDKGRKFLEKPYSVMVSINHDFDNLEDSEPEGGTGALDPQLLKMLQEVRKSEAAKVKLPPYILFQDPSLEEMATMYPTTIDELIRISGVSRGKAMKFGKPVITLIESYVEENDIEKPTEMLVRSVVNRSANKV